MGFLAPEALGSVFAIGVRRAVGHVQWIGSGFLYARRMNPVDDSHASNLIYVVSNKHVMKPNKSIVLRFSRLGTNEYEEFDQDLQPADEMRFFTHPTLDLAACLIHARILKERGLDFAFVSSVPHVATRDNAITAGITEGDMCYAVGFPMGLVGPNRHHPIVRQGCIARIQPFLRDNSEEILLDCAIFPGNSGGPVFTRPEVHSVKGSPPPAEGYFLGVVQAFVPYEDVAVSAQTGRPRVVFQENSGLASVVPAHCLYEWIESLPKTPEEAKVYFAAQNQADAK